MSRAGGERGGRAAGGSRLRAELGARSFPFEGWRKELVKDSVSRRKYRGDRPCFRARQSKNDLRIAVADAKAAVEHLRSFERLGQRALPLDGWRRSLGTCERAGIAGGWTRTDRLRFCAPQSPTRLSHCGSPCTPPFSFTQH